MAGNEVTAEQVTTPEDASITSAFASPAPLSLVDASVGEEDASLLDEPESVATFASRAPLSFASTVVADAPPSSLEDEQANIEIRP